jgi:polyisoprenoid-binding protein YceI
MTIATQKRPWIQAWMVLGALAHADGTAGVTFKLPYSMGTHDGKATRVGATVNYDPAHPESIAGSLAVRIEDLKTGNDERDCHMREALGLDYSKSDYPKDHVCDSRDKLATVGGNSVAYPMIIFGFKGMTGPNGGPVKIPGDVEVNGEWTIHGTTRPARVPMHVEPEGNGFRLTGKHAFSLKAYGVEVKSAHVLFVTISVDDAATAFFDVRLGPEK